MLCFNREDLAPPADMLIGISWTLPDFRLRTPFQGLTKSYGGSACEECHKCCIKRGRSQYIFRQLPGTVIPISREKFAYLKLTRDTTLCVLYSARKSWAWDKGSWSENSRHVLLPLLVCEYACGVRSKQGTPTQPAICRIGSYARSSTQLPITDRSSSLSVQMCEAYVQCTQGTVWI